jgi:hypothetical protein
MEFLQPSIEVLGIEINEPITVLTDLLISVVCLYSFLVLKKTEGNPAIRKLMMVHLAFMGLATAIGGIVGHGLMSYLSFAWKTPGWILSMVSIAALERAVILYALPLISKRLGTFFIWLNLIELITFVVLSFATLDFFFVEVHAGYGLVVVVASFSAFIYFKSKDRSAKTMLVGVFWSVVAAVFFTFKWGIGPWFNHFDLCHVFMAISTFYIFLGGKRMLGQKANHPS